MTFVCEPLRFFAPEHVVFRFPDVCAAPSKPKGFEPHRFQGDGSRENDQIGPRDAVAVFAFDRPEQTSGFIQVGVIGPAVQWCKALIAMAGTATAIPNAVSACAVPGQTDK